MECVLVYMRKTVEICSVLVKIIENMINVVANYILNMNNNNIAEPTKITITSYDTTVSWEVPYSDIDINKVLDGVVSCLLGITFTKETILNGMKTYLEENA